MTALHKASAAGQTAVVTLLLDHGADVHAATEVHVGDCSTALGVFFNSTSHFYLWLSSRVPSFSLLSCNNCTFDF